MEPSSESPISGVSSPEALTPQEKSSAERKQLMQDLVSKNSALEGKLLRHLKTGSGGNILIFNSTHLNEQRTYSDKTYFGVDPDMGPVAISKKLVQDEPGYTYDPNGEGKYERDIDARIGRILATRDVSQNRFLKVTDLISRVSTENEFSDWRAAYEASVVEAEKKIQEDARKYTTQALDFITSAVLPSEDRGSSTGGEAQFGVAHAVPEDAALMEQDARNKAALDRANTLGHSDRS